MINKTLLEFDTCVQQKNIRDKNSGKTWKRTYLYLQRDFLSLFKGVQEFYCKWLENETGRKILLVPDEMPYARKVTPEIRESGIVVFMPTYHVRLFGISKGSKIHVKIVEFNGKNGLVLSV